jgi:alpha-maltose-1-phosphate synthase
MGDAGIPRGRLTLTEAGTGGAEPGRGRPVVARRDGPASRSVAVTYAGDAYRLDGPRLLGRQAAGVGFLKALVAHGTTDPLFCYSTSGAQFEAFRCQVRPWSARPRALGWLPAGDIAGLARAGTLYRPDPELGRLAWVRRFGDQRAFSLCGVTHTVASQRAMAAIGELAIAPLQPWDALVCPSEAVRTVVTERLEGWSEYLATRLGGDAPITLKLPVIPLGVDCAAVVRGERAAALRAQLRGQLSAGPDDVVVLYLGRLVFSAKAHPVPMYLALEQAARASGTRLHLVQAGWFESEGEEVAFRQAARTFCPSVTCHVLDGRRPEVRESIWSAGDVFLSLADNAQETFGLTPIEAMVAGLPVVVSDWDGYRESVRTSVDGLRIPTRMAAPGAGRDLALGYLSGGLPHAGYVGNAAMSTAVDVGSCARALARLAGDPPLRRRLGDWPRVIAAYEALWAELAELRAAAPEIAPVGPHAPPHPLCDDPFSVFGHYAGEPWRDDWSVALGAMSDPERLADLRASPMSEFGASRRLPHAQIDALIATVAAGRVVGAAELIRQHGGHERAGRRRAMLTLLHLAKFDVLRIDPA